MSNDDFDYTYFNQLKTQSCALKLLSAEHFPLLASFFHHVFIRNNRRTVSYHKLIGLLDHHLADINEAYGEGTYPKSAKAYIDDWINVRGGYLRKYLPQNKDEPECDLLPEVEKALRWLEELQGRRFVGTESRLKMLLEMIRDLVHGTSQDKQAKLQTLVQKKRQLELEIEQVTSGLDSGYSDTQIAERMFLLSDMSRQLLGDFRAVEANFRSLDKEARKTIATGGHFKGKVLDRIFNDQDVIDGSDEGQSFSAFFELLMSPDMREAMRKDLKTLLSMEHRKVLSSQDELLLHLYSHMLDAGHKVNQTRSQINEQLRRYIQEQSQDDRRILELIREFEATAHRSLIDARQTFAEMDGFHADIDTSLSRRLFQPNEKEHFDSAVLAVDEIPEVDLANLFELGRIDEVQLRRNIVQCLNKYQGQVTLAQVVADNPIEYGLDEVLTYLKLACEQQLPAHIKTEQKQSVQWQVGPGLFRRLSIPHITFIREV